MSSSEKNKSPENLPQEVLCPSCGKFVGAYERCPYCQADLDNRFPLKIARRVAVIGSILGLILLYFASVNKRVETISVASIEANHNMALVKLKGKVADVKTNDQKNSINITLDDGTGRIKLSGFDKLDKFKRYFADATKSDGKGLPGAGDILEVKGNLNITDKWGAGIFLTSPKRVLILKRSQIEKRNIASFSDEDLNNVFLVQARVKGYKELGALKSIVLVSNDSEISLTIFKKEFENIKDAKVRKALLTPNSELLVKVLLSEYQSKLQLRLSAPEKKDSIKVLSMGKKISNHKKIALKDITQNKIGNISIVTATVKGVKKLNGLRIIKISDLGKTMDLVVYDDIFDSIPNEKMRKALTKMDSRITVTVKISEYKGALQLALVKLTPVLIGSGATSADAGEIVPLTEVSPSRAGETLTISGRIKAISHTTKGSSLTIESQGKIASVWLGKRVSEPVKKIPGLLVKGAVVKVTGKVTLFQGRSQIQPSQAKDIILWRK